MDEILKRKFGLELQFTKKEKIEFIKKILSAYWKMISVTLWQNNEELYWSRYAGEDNKQQLVVTFLVDSLNRSYAIQKEKEKNASKRRKEARRIKEQGNDPS